MNIYNNYNEHIYAMKKRQKDKILTQYTTVNNKSQTFKIGKL